MSAPAFTPGPWEASEMRMDKKAWATLAGDHDLTIVRANWDTFTGDVIACVWADDDHDERANARLIAAAPKLLALLIRYRNETPLGHQPHMIAHEVDAVLAEVSGEQVPA